MSLLLPIIHSGLVTIGYYKIDFALLSVDRSSTLTYLVIFDRIGFITE